ncbi:MAG: PKD domain-containing protein, partial [Solirubrobacteraceae bacterium]
MRSRERRNSISRRLGCYPGRRFVFAVAFALVAGTGGAAPAFADQTVVNATVYPASHGSVSTRSVTVSALGGCPLYTGPGQLTLAPSGQSLPLTSTTWSLATVISCGLHIPGNDVNTVQVLNPFDKTVDTLAAANLTDPGLYHDLQAPGALPLISLDESSGQATYARPWRGGSDANPILTSSAITLLVYAYGPPLIVTASAHTHGADVALSATVRNPDGTPVTGSGLRWSWSLGDGASSAAPTPVHRYTPGQSYSVSVLVSAPGNGTGGTDSILVTPPAHPASGKQTRSGGNQHAKSRSPTGGAGRTGRKTTTPSATATRPPGTQPAATATQPTAT